MGLSLVTFVHGNYYEQMFEINEKVFKNYARKIKAELVVIRNDEAPNYILENKFRASEIFKQFDRSLFLDVDVFVRNNSPNIFEIVPKGFLGILDELKYLGFTEHLVINEVRESQKLPLKPILKSYNSGVMVFDKEHAFLFEPPEERLPQSWCAEQNLLTIRIEENKIPVFELDTTFNCLYNYKYFTDKIEESFFIHFNGCPFDKRIKNLKQMRDEEFNFKLL